MPNPQPGHLLKGEMMSLFCTITINVNLPDHHWPDADDDAANKALEEKLRMLVLEPIAERFEAARNDLNHHFKLSWGDKR